MLVKCKICENKIDRDIAHKGSGQREKIITIVQNKNTQNGKQKKISKIIHIT